MLLWVIKRSVCDHSSLICPHNFLSIRCHYTSYVICNIIRHIYAPILLIFHPFLKTIRQASSQVNTRSEVEMTQLLLTGSESSTSDPCPHVKHSRLGTATERNWDVTETFLSVWTSPFNYTWEKFTERRRSATERNWNVTETIVSVWTSPFNYTWEKFTERWRSATERKHDVWCESALRHPFLSQ